METEWRKQRMKQQQQQRRANEWIEFLMYHVVNGSYFSQDLRDGQQLATLFDNKPLQVGVRVDGCSRK